MDGLASVVVHDTCVHPIRSSAYHLEVDPFAGFDLFLLLKLAPVRLAERLAILLDRNGRTRVAAIST